MPLENTVDVTLQDLRAIIHGLKMTSLSFVEPEALDEIEAMIKSLPGAEELNQYAMDPPSLKQLQAQIGGIMRIIELYSKRDSEYKTRYKSRTGLPPRYPVLEWRDQMPIAASKTSKTNKMEIKNSLVKNLIRLSQDIDNEGLFNFASSLLSCAKDIRDNNNIPIKNLYIATKTYVKKAGLHQVGLRKEAQALTDIDMDMGDIRNGFAQVQAWFDNIQEALQQKSQYLGSHPKTQVFLKQLGEIWQQVAQLKESTNAQVDQIDQNASVIEKGMEELVPQYVEHLGQQYDIEFIPDPNDTGWEMAVTTIDGKTYEVQRGSDNVNVIGPEVKEQVEQVEVPESVSQGEVVQERSPEVIPETSTLTSEQQTEVERFKAEPPSQGLKSKKYNLQQSIDRLQKSTVPTAKKDIDHYQNQIVAIDYLLKQQPMEQVAFNLKRYLS